MVAKLVKSVIANGGVGRYCLHDPNLNKSERLYEAGGPQEIPEWSSHDRGNSCYARMAA